MYNNISRWNDNRLCKVRIYFPIRRRIDSSVFYRIVVRVIQTMNREETIENVEYYIREYKEYKKGVLKFIITPDHIAIIDPADQPYPDRYIIKEQKIGAKLYAELLAVAKVNI